MKEYKVLTENVGGFGNRTYKKGDKVTAANFPKGNIEALVKAKCIEAVVEKKAPTKK